MNIFLSVLLIVALLAAVVGYVFWSAFRLPSNRPDSTSRPADGTRVVALLGDSLTHGRVGAPWVERLNPLPGNEPTLFVNGGINGELAWNLAERLDPVIALKPAAATVLIGTNDALATLSAAATERYIKTNNLPQAPDPTWFEANLRDIVERLQRDTNAHIALLSIPPISEVPDSEAWDRAAAYTAIIKRVASENALTYLPLHERFVETIANASGSPQPFTEDLGSILTGSARYYLTPARWNDVADSRGMHLLTDHIHWNERGAEITATLVNDWLASLPADRKGSD